MPYGNAIPLTGGAGALVMGHYLGLDDIIATAIVAVLFAIAAFRYGSRISRARGKIFMLTGAAVLGVALLAHLGGLSWPLSVTAGLTTAVLALYLSSRLVGQERRAVAP
jgi:predicted membrane protein